MLRGRGSQVGLTGSLPASSFRIGSLQPLSGAPLAAGCAMEELRKEAGAIAILLGTTRSCYQHLACLLSPDNLGTSALCVLTLATDGSD